MRPLLLTTTDVGKRLGFTGGRVRQLIREHRLAPDLTDTAGRSFFFAPTVEELAEKWRQENPE